jgi:ribonuclease Z
VLAGGGLYVIDTGPGAWNNLALWRIPGNRLRAVFLTHFHSDHIGELGEFNLQTWAAGRTAPLPVYGPVGVDGVVAGFTQAYALDTTYRVAHHGAELMDPAVGKMVAVPVEFAVASTAAHVHSTTVLDEGGLKVTAFAVDHRPVIPAVGYRFDFAGRSVVISGDTVKQDGLTEAARGVDVLVHEAQADHMVAVIREVSATHGLPRIAKILSDIPSYHTPPKQAADVANAAGVSLLVLTHLTPPPPNALAEKVFLRGVSAVRSAGVVLGKDGLVVSLPAGKKEVELSSIE